jgi:Holliday junction resolvase
MSIKPDKMIYVYSNDTKNEMSWLKTMWSGKCLESIIADPFKYEDCHKMATEILVKYINDELILNFTGGTKIISIAFFNAFFSAGKRNVYIDSQNHRILSVLKDEIKYDELIPEIDITTHLGLYGKRFKAGGHKINPKEANNRKLFEKYISGNFQFFGGTLMLPYAQKRSAEKEWKFDKKNQNILPRIDVHTTEETMKRITGSNIQYNAADQKVTLELNNLSDKQIFYISGRDANDYICGEWYESYLVSKFTETGLFSDIKHNIKILYSDPASPNTPEFQIDIAALKRDVLYIFEVKTGNFRQESINKLTAVKEFVGGTYAVPIIISYFKNYDSNLLKKAEDHNIDCMTNETIDNFLEELKNPINAQNIRT